MARNPTMLIVKSKAHAEAKQAGCTRFPDKQIVNLSNKVQGMIRETCESAVKFKAKTVKF